jgi:uncharacterized membrane protein YphA (DoxX/SURF4 family)
VLPHVLLFSRLVVTAELSTGLLLLSGLAIPFAALLVIWLNTNYMLAKGLTSPSGSMDRLFVLMGLVLIVTQAGRYLSLDSLLLRLWKRGQRDARSPLVPPARWIDVPGRSAA